MQHENILKLKDRLRQIIRSPYEVEDGISLSTINFNRYDPDLIITKNDTIIAFVEGTTLSEPNVNYILRFKKILKQFGCSFGIIYYEVNEKTDVYDVRKVNLDNYSLEEHTLTLDDLKNILYEDIPKEHLQKIWQDKIINLLNEKQISQSEINALEVLKNSKLNYDYITGVCTLEYDDENHFFKNLLNPYVKDYICRYTTYESLERILRDKKQSVCSIVCMNDETECYYADEYLSHQNSESASQLLANYKELNSCQISSCTDISKADQLSMWRMYGDDAKGVCLIFKIDKDILAKSDFLLYSVDYATSDGEHSALRLISSLLDMDINNHPLKFKLWRIWKHFFKPSYYMDECEVRLLYFKKPKDSLKWIKTCDSKILAPIIEFSIEKNKNEFPLILSKIILGPKFPEANTNSVQIQYFMEDQDVEREAQCPIIQSIIRGYR